MAGGRGKPARATYSTGRGVKALRLFKALLWGDGSSSLGRAGHDRGHGGDGPEWRRPDADLRRAARPRLCDLAPERGQHPRAAGGSQQPNTPEPSNPTVKVPTRRGGWAIVRINLGRHWPNIASCGNPTEDLTRCG